MEIVETFHMNKGVGETSYAMNSAVQEKINSVMNPTIKKAIVQVINSNWPVKMSIADLGCSSGPNTLRQISEIIDIIFATSCKLICLECTTIEYTQSESPTELVVYLNDLFRNDFNSICASLPTFYKKIRQEKGLREFGSCFISLVPGNFYGRLFPIKSLHFVHSSSSLHWLSKAPNGLEDERGIGLNKGKVYISKGTPQCVLQAYSQQFQNDFSLFLESRSQEVVPGGCMVLSLFGRKSADPTITHSCFQWDLLALALMSMVSEGLVEEEKVDSFNVPYYAPCIEELQLAIEKEGSFNVEAHEAHEGDLDGEAKLHNDLKAMMSSGERVARTVRAVIEPLLAFHFGSHIMDELFRRFGKLVDDYLSKTRTKFVYLVLTLVKRD